MTARSPTILRPQEKTGSNGNNPITNRILLSVPTPKYKELFSKMQLVEFKLHEVLYEADSIIKHCYFVNSGLISLVSVQNDEKSVEIGLTGKEGFVGLPIVVGYASSPTKAVVQGDGNGYRCDVATLREVMRGCPELELQLNRYSQQLAMQTAQITVCNRLHEVQQRLARWILSPKTECPVTSSP